MKNVLAMIAATGLLAVPQVTFAADPVEVTYEDAVKCAAVDTTLAIALTADESKMSAEDKENADYLSSMADKWLAQASAANPGGEEATTNDIVTRSTDMFLALVDESNKDAQAKIASDLASCMILEEAAYGGRNGLVD